ncbi:MAG: sigma-70 family RNA polymerase sigma factor [Pseudomonadota bacterium]
MSDREKVSSIGHNIEHLVKTSQMADRGAFDELVRLFQRQAMKTAFRVTGDVNEACEAVQQGFVKAYIKIGTLKNPEHFGTWLLRIVINTAISQQKAAKRRWERIKIDGSQELNNTVSQVDQGSENELKEAIRLAMTKLSAKEAKAISLFGIEDLPQKEVAEIMGCSVEAVRYHVFKARKKLKVLLKDYLA